MLSQLGAGFAQSWAPVSAIINDGSTPCGAKREAIDQDNRRQWKHRAVRAFSDAG